MIDLRQSRKNYNLRCTYWIRQEDEKDMSLIEFERMQRVPTGHFRAKFLNAIKRDKQIIGGNFMIDATKVQIETRDFVPKLKAEDVIKIENEYWRVMDSQDKPTRAQNTYFKSYARASKITVIDIRK